MMKLFRHLVMTALVLAASAVPAFSQGTKDVLESIAKNRNLTIKERAQIEVEVTHRARKLNDATTEEHRKAARDILIGSSRIPGATASFLESYAEQCGAKLASLTGSQKLETAVEAVLVLVALDHEATAEGLAAALTSSHHAVRYKAARGVQMLHKKLKDPSRVATLMEALGSAGANQSSDNDSNRLVLREIFRAIDIRASVPDTKFCPQAAEALATALRGRVQRLSNSSAVAESDVDGAQAAARCYAALQDPQQTAVKTALVKQTTNLIELCVEQYFDPEASSGARAILKKQVKAIEDAVHDMMKASKVTPPNASIATSLPKDGVSRDSTQKALEELRAKLAGPPWNIKQP